MTLRIIRMAIGLALGFGLPIQADTPRANKGALPATTTPTEPNNAQAWNEEGLRRARDQQYDRAIAAYQQALTMDPKHAEAYANMANAHLGKRDTKAAIRFLEKAAALDPQYAAAYQRVLKAFPFPPITYNPERDRQRRDEIEKTLKAFQSAPFVPPRWKGPEKGWEQGWELYTWSDHGEARFVLVKRNEPPPDFTTLLRTGTRCADVEELKKLLAQLPRFQEVRWGTPGSVAPASSEARCVDPDPETAKEVLRYARQKGLRLASNPYLPPDRWVMFAWRPDPSKDGDPNWYFSLQHVDDLAKMKTVSPRAFMRSGNPVDVLRGREELKKQLLQLFAGDQLRWHSPEPSKNTPHFERPPDIVLREVAQYAAIRALTWAPEESPPHPKTK